MDGTKIEHFHVDLLRYISEELPGFQKNAFNFSQVPLYISFKHAYALTVHLSGIVFNSVNIEKCPL